MSGLNVSNITSYLSNLNSTAKTGVAHEHAYRPFLHELLKNAAPSYFVVNEPSQIECGAPDFVVLSQTYVPVGHVEAKDLGHDLSKTEETEQLRRYRAALPNLILTNHTEFIHYKYGEPVNRVRIAYPKKGGISTKLADPYSSLTTLIEHFLKSTTETIDTSAALAKHLSAAAKLIHLTVYRRLTLYKSTDLHVQRDYFSKILSMNIDSLRFADMYAQTITYGLFSAACNHDNNTHFSRETASYDLPKSNPFLKSIFHTLAGPEMDISLVWAVDQTVDTLRRTNITTVLEEFAQRTGRTDAIFHFYEDFLSYYDPDLKEKRGVYYTPEPAVTYIISSVHSLLTQKFGIHRGLADTEKIKDITTSDHHKKSWHPHRVIVLDPATGTGTFLDHTIRLIYEYEKEHGRGGAWPSYVREHVLPRIVGFELLMAPYTIAHLKLGLLLSELGFDFTDDERLGIYLTNTLDEAHQLFDTQPFSKALRDEGREAAVLKRTAPVMVILGNPPYSGHSANAGSFQHRLLRGYDTLNQQETHSFFHIDGVPIGERQPKWLNDDYVKFIRFSMWKIEQNGHGIVAFVTNHNFISAPTFRAMRKAILECFDEVYVLNLHGNTKRREIGAQNTGDENIFDIQQGVAITIFVKTGVSGASRHATVSYSQLVGPRSTAEGDDTTGKYKWLAEHDASSVEWDLITPISPFYLFVPRNEIVGYEYVQGHSVKDIFEMHGVGMIGGRDKFNFAFTHAELEERIERFLSLSDEEARQEFELGKDSTSWSVEKAKNDILNNDDVSNLIKPVLYRPFEYRYTYFSGKSNGFLTRPTKKINELMTNEGNLAILTSRSVEIEAGWSHVVVIRSMAQHHAMSSKEVNYLFPLLKVEEVLGTCQYQPNFTSAFLEMVRTRIGLSKSVVSGAGSTLAFARAVFAYIVAILHSGEYRLRYSEPLRDDFPRIPITNSAELFYSLRDKGEEIIELEADHVAPEQHAAFTEGGTQHVEYVQYNPELQRVYINQDQYFGNVPENVFNFTIGGTIVVWQWLIDRVGRSISNDEVAQAQSVIDCLRRLSEIPGEIDDIIDHFGGWPIGP